MLMMPEELRDLILKEIVGSADDQHKQILLLFLRLESQVLERIDALIQSLDDDMRFVRSLRETGNGARGVVARLAFEVAKGGTLVLAGAIGAKFFH